MKLALAALLLPVLALGQAGSPGEALNATLAEATHGRLKLNFEFRSRFETRTGNDFGRGPNLENALLRTRIGLQYQATEWLTLSATGQDSRAPFYGRPAGSLRDTMDLQEAYLELFRPRKTGFGMVLGRRMVVYGEGRLIGVPEWANTSRTYDQARVYYRHPNARIEFLLVSPVKIKSDAFNRPVLGDRVWGTYNSFPKLLKGGVLEAYFLRHDQNGPGGFAGAGRLAVNSFGARAAGALPLNFGYSLEGILQNGEAGAQRHRGQAWVSNFTRKIDLRLPIEILAGYKYASGTDRPGGKSETTFDQLYPANHDRFGHADILGWRNLHALRVRGTVHATKKLALNLMYNNLWLASPRDALYGPSGTPIARSPNGAAGRHIGQEADVFGTYRFSGYTVGAGFAHLFSGQFLRQTTPGVNTRYLYVFQSYSF